MTKRLRGLVSLLLVFVLCFGMLPGFFVTEASAASTQGSIMLFDFSDNDDYTSRLNSQLSVAYKPNGSGTTRTAYIKNQGWHFARYGNVPYADDPLYCIEPWRNYGASTSGNSVDRDITLNGSYSSSGSNVWYSMPADRREAIGLILLYSDQMWDDSISVFNVKRDSNPNVPLRVATQFLIYEIVCGLRNPTTFALNSTNECGTRGDIFYNAGAAAISNFAPNYNTLVSYVQSALKRPTDSACTKAVSGSPFTTGIDGTVTVSNLVPGTYYAKEIAVSDPYWVCDSSVETVQVAMNQTATVSFSNTHYGDLRVTKQPVQNPEEIRTKDFFDCVAPGVVKFFADSYLTGDSYRSAWVVKEYPPSTEEQVILSQLAERNGVTLGIYHRLVEPMEQRQIVNNANRKNRLMAGDNDINEASRQHNKNLIRYIATREGVEKLDDSWKSLPVSQPQKNMIEQLLKDFPDAVQMYEYQDFLASPTKGNAYEFITRCIEENLDQIDKRENYVQYIAKRPRVERFGTHGLFTNADIPINLPQMAQEVAEYDGIVMTQILSLRREDAMRLGYDRGEAWRDLIRGKADDMAEAMNIPIQDLRWYAAFHNEGHHPHCHIVAYSAGKQPYMTEQVLINLKSSFAKGIFHQDLIQIYQEQTKYRDTLRMDAKDIVAQIVEEINSGTYKNEVVEAMLRELALRLRNTKGKKVYGYLSTPARNLVNGIIDELAKDSRIAELYDLWYEQRDKVVQTYQTAGDDRVPLSQNKTFHPIRNVVVTEALKLSLEDLVLEKAPEEKLPEKVNVSWDAPREAAEDIKEVSAAEQLAKRLEKESTGWDESSRESRWQFANRHRSNPYLVMTCARLVANIAQIIQEDIEKEQKQLNLIDRKLRRKIAEKKQLHGQRMG